MDSLFSDYDSFSESSSSDDQDDLEFPYDGHAFSILSSLEETLGKIDDFLSFERGFVLGDVVSSLKDPSGQIGKVIDVDIMVGLENIHGGKVQNVNSKVLKRIRSISVGDFVVNGAWLGKVEKVGDRVIVLFDDGTKSEFTASGLENLIPTSPDLLEDSQYLFYPGQRVQLASSSSPRWLCGMKKDIKNQGTVFSVDAGLVYVDWLSCAVVSCEKAPPSCLDSKNLTLLSCFSHANWQLGDWCLIPVIDSRSFKGQNFVDASACRLVKGQEQLEMLSQRGNLNLKCQEIAVITKMKTTVNVLWQDGSYSIGLDSHSLLSLSVTDAHDFIPGQFVLEKGICDDSTLPSVQRWGIVKCVDAKERTVKVKWHSVAIDQPNSVKLQQTEEIVSAYELTEHPDYSYCLGDAVFRHKCHCTKQSDENVYENHLTSAVVGGTESDLKDTDNSKDIKGYCYRNFLSCIGIVVGLQDGDIEVTWASGATNKVSPHKIYKAEKCEVSSTTVHSENSEQSSEGSTVPDNEFLEQGGKDKLGFKGCNENEDSPKKLWGSSSYSFPQAAMGLLTSISSTLFGSISTSLFGAYENLSENGKNCMEVLELCSTHTADTPVMNYLEISGETNLVLKVNQGGEEKDHAPTLDKECPEYFRQFDVVSDCADHHFVDSAGKGPHLSQIKRGCVKKVQQEWNILEKDLPETIYVRVYEERMDLLRAAIVGAPGTPYHDNLFFFDICLSPEYPHEPPMIYYNSGGLRVNPNLYESGKVCLSLLNTWAGSGSEVWNPEKSTILQVLLSLQALVLNEKPYFNEAGYDSQIGKAEGEKNSVCYNENAFLMSCKSMLYLLRKPPKHFEALVDEHFSQRCKHILLSCKAYMEGAPVGSAFVNEKIDQAPKSGSSTGFKIMLAKLYPKLVEAFADKGMDCSNLLYQNE